MKKTILMGERRQAPRASEEQEGRGEWRKMFLCEREKERERDVCMFVCVHCRVHIHRVLHSGLLIKGPFWVLSVDVRVTPKVFCGT